MVRTFVGLGFGAIQGGLFLYEAYRSGNFDRFVVAEIMPDVVEAVRQSGGYAVNIATHAGVEQQEVDGLEILNPTNPEDAATLIEALANASEIAVALPSVEFYQRGNPSPAALLANGLKAKRSQSDFIPCVVYAGENHNHAAELLEQEVRKELGASATDALQGHQFLNTVIGKMSGVVADGAQMERDALQPMAPGLQRAFLVEAFNHILISRIELSGFQRGIDVLVEKPELLPFEEAKLYGHNATHALVGYLAHRKGYATMAEALAEDYLRDFAREAFLQESGAPLIARYAGVDPLFTPDGYMAYVDDLLKRMANPHLEDSVERIIRDPERKLAWEDRLIGTLRLAISAGVEPTRFALGAAAALEYAQPGSPVSDVGDALRCIWATVPEAEADAVITRVEVACKTLQRERPY